MATARPFSSVPKAFSLIEMVFATSLVLLVLVLIGNFFTQMQRGQTLRVRTEQAAQAQQTAWELLAADLRAAVRLRVASGSNLDFDLPDDRAASYMDLLPLPAADPPWNPLSQVVRVRYRVSQRRLLREVAVGPGFDSVCVLPEVDAFEVQRPAPQEVRLTLRLPGMAQQRQLTRQLQLPIQAVWSQP